MSYELEYNVSDSNIAFLKQVSFFSPIFDAFTKNQTKLKSGADLGFSREFLRLKNFR